MNIKEAYNDWSEIYDSNLNKTRDLDLIVSKTILSGTKFKHILEIGCGTGKNTEWLSKIADNVTSVDFSDKMLEIARLKIKAENVRFVQADINQNWSFTSEKFDLITYNLVLEHIEDLDKIFQKSNLKLEYNGKLFISELHPFKQYLGTKAKFEINNVIKELQAFTHNISDFWLSAEKYNFHCLKFNEWKSIGEENEVPRLISFLFEKQ